MSSTQSLHRCFASNSFYISGRYSLALPGFVSVLPDKLFEQWRVSDVLTIRLVSCFTESPVDGANQGSLAAEVAAISQNTGAVAPHVVADLLEVL
jgi:hypothetical protein